MVDQELVILWSNNDIGRMVATLLVIPSKKCYIPAHMVGHMGISSFFCNVMIVWSYMFDHIMATS